MANEVVFRLDVVVFALDFESLFEMLLPLESTLDLGFIEQGERSSLLRLLSDQRYCLALSFLDVSKRRLWLLGRCPSGRVGLLIQADQLLALLLRQRRLHRPSHCDPFPLQRLRLLLLLSLAGHWLSSGWLFGSLARGLWVVVFVDGVGLGAGAFGDHDGKK